MTSRQPHGPASPEAEETEETETPGVPDREATGDGEAEAPADTRGERLRRSLADLHFRLRTEGDSPRRHGAAVALGTAVGAIPVYGLHLALCTVLARMLRLSRVVTYLAAHINNPLTLPFLLYAELGLGHWLLTGDWPDLSMDHLRSLGFLRLGRDVMLGSLVLGVVMGTVFGLLAWAISRRRRPSRFSRLREAAAEPYLAAGVLHWEFVRGKLRYDPVFGRLLRDGVLPRRGTLVDLGCGRGILLTLLATLAEVADPPPEETADMELVGIELRESAVRAARAALGDRGRVEQGDLAHHPIPACDTAVLLDVLHYMPASAQEALLRRVVAALRPAGVLIIREADDGGGWRFAVTRAAERLRAVGRLHLRQRFHYRDRKGWTALVERLGLAVDARPMAHGTPYANVLLVARKPAATNTDAAAGAPPLADGTDGT